MSTRICSKPACPKFVKGERFCPAHQPVTGWVRSPSRAAKSRLRGPELTKRNNYVMRRDGRICHVCGREGADEVDHKVPLWEFVAGIAKGDPETLDNVGPIHSKPCHRNKTAAEAAKAKRHYARTRRR